MDKLNENFQKFLQIIHNWPTSTIEKATLIQMLDDFCHHNPELQNIYDNTAVPVPIHPVSDDDEDTYSRIQPSENDVSRSVVGDIVKSLPQPTVLKGNQASKKETISKTILVKDGDLTVRKGSTTLSPLLKKNGWKTTVYGELSYSYYANERLLYFTVYQNRKTRKTIHAFIIDDTCSFLCGNKREFQFKHGSAVEYFTTETGTADTWIASFAKTSKTQESYVEEVYENPDDLLSIPVPSVLHYLHEAPVRPPPRPVRSTSTVLPENVYVCLYDHHTTTNDSDELEFNRGDLLYIINTDGPNFYIGRQFTPPFKDHSRNPVGLVFKEYIRPAYEKVS